MDAWLCQVWFVKPCFFLNKKKSSSVPSFSVLLHFCEVSNFTIIRFNCSISSEVKPEIVNPHLYLAYYNPKCQLGNIKKKSSQY